MIGALAALLVCQLVGELLARTLHLPVPGPVIGMVLLFATLLLRGGDAEPPPELVRTADALLGNLGLLFVPAGVGIVIYGPLIAANWLPIALTVLLGTLLAIAFTGRLAQALFRRLR